MDDIVKEQKENKDREGEVEENEDELEMMKMFGIPTIFDSTKGKLVPGADVNDVSAITKRQLCQYMNRRNEFNRPLLVERNLVLGFSFIHTMTINNKLATTMFVDL
ncbi:U4/U6.U5 small nuclear ribonucleoprotein 27 kDa protein-like [Glycine soja]|uniref:U4/U6.U5 small nuclear ribonucleoprotein 27 kDa protein-like n=1 Tax=Glycine soja TaxID=3848 RepID=UPI00103FDF11|nr:U4/U6.U5 small nuclear ribonucleoprotein 27 kDa protein-like [Glycine soja]